MKIPNKKIIVLVVFAVILAIGIFLRAYNFSDWLHFELDQSRDAKIVSVAVEEGPENLPLLGPRAAGTFLRLGPVFYYFKYVSALIFGNTPGGMAIIIMIFGILAMPVFYFFTRRYFSKTIAFSLLAIFATSLFLVMYSRFSWNPNPLVLFIILAFYGLLRAVDHEEKNRGNWLLISALAIAISTQLHFLAFVAIPCIAFVFLIIKRPRISLKYWIGALAIILVINLPIIINDVKTGGKNFSELLEAVSGKTEKGKSKSLFEKIQRNCKEHAAGYFLLLSSKNSELPTLRTAPSFKIMCNADCRKNFPLGAISGLLLIVGTAWLFKRKFSERDPQKRDFLLLVLIWFGVSFLLFLQIAFKISPRFWLLVSALPFVFLGFIFEFLKNILSKRAAFCVATLITLSFCLSNLYEAKLRFAELKKAPYEAFESSTDRILKEQNRVTLEQKNMVVDYMESFYKQNNYPVYLDSDPYHKRSFLFILESRKIPRADFSGITRSGKEKIYRNGNYFWVFPTRGNIKNETEKYSNFYDVQESKEFGTLKVWRLAPKAEAINEEQQDIAVGKESNAKKTPGVPKRYTWEEIFEESAQEEIED